MPPPGSIWANGRGASRSGPAVSVQWVVRSAAPTSTGTRTIVHLLHMMTTCHLSSDCRGPHCVGLDSDRTQSGCHDADATPASPATRRASYGRLDSDSISLRGCVLNATRGRRARRKKASPLVRARAPSAFYPDERRVGGGSCGMFGKLRARAACEAARGLARACV